MATHVKELRLDPATTAFLIVDMQNDFLDPEGYFARRGRRIHSLRRTIEPTRQLRHALPPAVKTIFTTQIYEPDGTDDLTRVHAVIPAALTRSGNDLPARRGSWGAEIIPDLEPGTEDRIVAKRRFDAFHQTDLELLLRCWGVKTLLIGGVVADVCVETTARAAYVRDFDVVLATDCVGGWQARDLRRTIEVIGNHFGACLNNQDILATFARRTRR